MNDVIRSLRELAAYLDEIGVRYALIGGLAVSIHSEPRFTSDVDLVVAVSSDEEAESIIYRLVNRGVTSSLGLGRNGRTQARQNNPSFTLFYERVVIDLVRAKGEPR